MPKLATHLILLRVKVGADAGDVGLFECRAPGVRHVAEEERTALGGLNLASSQRAALFGPQLASLADLTLFDDLANLIGEAADGGPHLALASVQVDGWRNGRCLNPAARLRALPGSHYFLPPAATVFVGVFRRANASPAPSISVPAAFT